MNDADYIECAKEIDGLKSTIVGYQRASAVHEDEIRSLRRQVNELRREVAVLQGANIDLRTELVDDQMLLAQADALACGPQDDPARR